ncbi:hypothetical protein RCH10_000755 [Variovorax sp. GrIS 2.14]|uniref:PLxRFG domain-containing protein n=1 Tax=Variovorax sp. GrIS 2.14 TaxID=3071709 RepID=UPI0038F754BA
MNITEVRAQNPEWKNLDDQQVVNVVHQVYYPDMEKAEIAKALGVKDAVPPPAERSWSRVAGDVGISALKGAIGVPEAAVGLLDIPTMGYAGKAAEAVGFRPKDAKGMLDDLYSDKQKAAFKEVNDAEGFGNTAMAALRNPSVIGHSVVESLPSMAAGGVVGRGVMAGAPKLAGMVAGGVGKAEQAAIAAGPMAGREAAMAGARSTAAATGAAGIGEGVVGAGSQAEQIRQETPDGLLTLGQGAAAVATGVATTAFGVLGAKVAKSLGIHDVDTMLIGATQSPVKAKGIVKRVLEGMASEGILEELPQSISEQVLQNLALGKPLEQGVDHAAVLGLLAGAAMGGGANVMSGGHAAPAAAATPPAAVPPVPAAPLGLPSPTIEVGPDGMATTAGDRNASMAASQGREGQIFQKGATVDGLPVLPQQPRGALARAAATATGQVTDVQIKPTGPLATASAAINPTTTNEPAINEAPSDAGVPPATAITGPSTLPGDQSQPGVPLAPPTLPAPVADLTHGDASQSDQDAYDNAMDAHEQSLSFQIADPLEAEAAPEAGAAHQSTDILNSKGKPFTIKLAATKAAANAGPGHEVVAVEGGFAVRNTGETNAQDQVPDAGQRPSGAPAIPEVATAKAADRKGTVGSGSGVAGARSGVDADTKAPLKSEQYGSYAKWINDGKAVPIGMQQQIQKDTRLEDGEAAELLSMAGKQEERTAHDASHFGSAEPKETLELPDPKRPKGSPFATIKVHEHEGRFSAGHGFNTMTEGHSSPATKTPGRMYATRDEAVAAAADFIRQGAEKAKARHTSTPADKAIANKVLAWLDTVAPKASVKESLTVAAPAHDIDAYLDKQIPKVLGMFQGRLTHNRLMGNLGDPQNKGYELPDPIKQAAIDRLLEAGTIVKDGQGYKLPTAAAPAVVKETLTTSPAGARAGVKTRVRNDDSPEAHWTRSNKSARLELLNSLGLGKLRMDLISTKSWADLGDVVKAKLVKQFAADTAPVSKVPPKAAGPRARKITAGDRARARAWIDNPMGAFLGLYGINLSLVKQWAPGIVEQRKAMVQGYPTIFRKTGLNLDMLAQAAVSDGFLTEPDVPALEALIDKWFRKERVIPQFAEGVGEDEMANRLAAAREAEEDAALALDALAPETRAELEQDSDIPWLDAVSNATTEQMLRAMGASEQEIQDALAAEAEGTKSRNPGAGQIKQGDAGAAPANASGSDRTQRSTGTDTVADSAGAGLSSPSPAEVSAKQEREAAGIKAAADAKKATADKLDADAAVGDFTLTGSDPAADVGASQGQGGIFDEPAAPAPSHGAGNTIFTADMAAAARARMKAKLGRLNSGIDPELLQDGITLAGYHIEAGARTFGAFVKAMVGDMGDGIKPYLQSFYMALKHDARAVSFKKEMSTEAEVDGFDMKAKAEAAAVPVAPAASNQTLSGHLYDAIKAGGMPKDNIALKKVVEAFDKAPATPARMKQAQEALEAAIATTARAIAAKNEGPASTFASLLRIYKSQPLLNVRTSTSVANQAYSTPAPLAFLASELAGIKKGDSVLEPTGGTGMLLMRASIGRAVVNELDPARQALLSDQGFDVTGRDAVDGFPGVKVQRVITNPPFGSIKGAEGKPIKVKVDGYNIGQIDHLIAARALAAMDDDGRAVLILGANKITGQMSNDDLIFHNWLYSHYNVTGQFEVEGDLYTRQGASWPVRVIIINGRAASTRTAPIAGTIERADTWEKVYEQYTKFLAAAGQEPVRVASGSTGRASAVEAGAKPVPAPAVAAPSGNDRRGPAGGTVGAGNVAGGSTKPVADSGGRTGVPVGGSADEQRLGAEPIGANRVEPVGKPDRPAGNKPAGTAGTAALSTAENQFQATYVARSARKDEGVLIPVNMRDPMQDALSRLEDAVGDIDDYAARELGYKSTDELHQAFMGLQVDSVASAIYQMDKGKAVIIADQTGIGKGRQAAGIIRWALKKGYTPVFVSVKPSLFTDMHGDLADIGSHDIAPFILNSDASIAGASGEKLFANKPTGHKKRLELIRDGHGLPNGANAVFMTYSQINVENTQRGALTAIAPNAVFILDESHNAGGESNTGNFMRGLLDLAKGVTYLSATYAKRPDNMPLYFKTDMGQAASDDNGLMNAMAAGGLPLQTVVSNNLVKAGQMFRRERSYDGVSIASVTDTANKAHHEEMSDRTTQALRAIVTADRLFHSVFVKAMKEQLAAEGARVLDNAGNQAEASVDHTEFSSVVHNFVKQMLLGMKAQAAAESAIEQLKAGKKPIIAVENTMGSFLNEYADANGIALGGTLGDFDYRTVLSRALARTLFITEQNAQGDKVKRLIPRSQLDGLTAKAYNDAEAIIDALDLDIPVSPIDHMRQALTAAGYTVAEITGRNRSVDYSNGAAPVLSQVDPLEQKDKVRTTRLFNSGKLDALILNVAGSTGISLHASEKFTDQRPRFMIVAQPAGDINIVMQMLGRIHRTGQVALPAYSLLSADLPTEKRPTALLSKKMKGLNANTSSNTESATSIKSADMLNKYGDQIVGQYLAENIMLSMELGINGPMTDSGPMEDVARKATGRLALQPIKVQTAFYEEVETQYLALIDYLNKTNQNDLEPRTFDFDAKEVKTQVLFAGEDHTTPFGEDAIYGEYSIKAQGKPMTPVQITEAIDEHLEGKTGKAHAAAMLARAQEQFQAWLPSVPEDQRSLVMTSRDNTASFIAEHAIGEKFRVDINGDSFNAVVTNLRTTHKTTGNPFAMSKIQVTIAVNGALRSVTVPASQFATIQVSNIQRGFTIEQLFKEGPADQREVAKIVTGNLLAAYGEIDGARGTIISFTKADGTTEQGILLPKTFTFEANTKGDHRLATPAEAVAFLHRSTHKDIERFGITTRDQVVRVTPFGGSGITISVPKSKLKGGKYFLDQPLIAAIGDDFVTSGGQMKATTLDGAEAKAALEVLMKKGALYALPSMSEEAKQITDAMKPVPTAPAANRPAMGNDAVAEAKSTGYDSSDDFNAPPGQPDDGTASDFAAADSSAAPSVRGSGGAVQRRAVVTALGIADRIERAGSQALIGQTVQSADDLAALAQVYRDPRYETTRLFFVKDGTIVHSTGVSARMPGYTPLVPQGWDYDGYMNLLNEQMMATGADSYYLLHNHPTGDPTASDPDLRVTENLARDVPGMLAHVIINSNKYSVINLRRNGSAKSEVKMHELGPDQLLQASKPAAVLGVKLLGTLDLAVAAKSMQKPGWITLVGTDSGGAVRVLSEAPSSILGRSYPYLAGTVRRLIRNSGSEKVFAVGSNADMNSAPIVAAIKAGILTDAQPAVGESLRKSGVVGGTAPRVKGRYLAEESAPYAVDGVNDTRDYRAKASDLANDLFKSPGVVSWWHKSVGTMHDLAQRQPAFRRVYDGVQTFLQDVSYYATQAADLAPSILPKLDSLRDLKKSALSHADVKGMSRAVFEGTLTYTRDGAGKLVKHADLEAQYAKLSTDEKGQMLLRKNIISAAELKTWKASQIGTYEGAINNRFDAEFLKEGAVFTDAELVKEFGSTPRHIALYREFHAASTKSLNQMGIAEMIRFGGKRLTPAIREQALNAGSARAAGILLRDFLNGLAEGHQPAATMTDKLKGEIRAEAAAMMVKADAIAADTTPQEDTQKMTDLKAEWKRLSDEARELGLAGATTAADRLMKQARQAQDGMAEITQAFNSQRAGRAAALRIKAKTRLALALDPARVPHPESADMLDTANSMIEKSDKIQSLIDRGYAPLSRYGQYTLDIVDAAGNRLFFGMYEGKTERGAKVREMRKLYPQGKFTMGTNSEQSYKLFNGITPETLELFGQMVGLEGDGNSPQAQMFQSYLKLAKSNRSAMKRLIERKGIAGFNEDAGRVLAGFIYSNARLTSQNLHQGEITEATAAIPKEQGQLKDMAINLTDYVRNPQEEAQKIRGLLFSQYIGGSIASALVNMTQPFAVTMPYLSQYGGMAKSAANMQRAVRDVMAKTTGDAVLDKALKHAEDEGIVAPQEVHQLMAQARGQGSLKSGDGTLKGDAIASVQNLASKVGLAWGKPFSIAEQFNRRVTFIAAYRTAVAHGMGDPVAFAVKAINDTQFVYNKGNKPQWARGAVGGIVFTFKQYSISYTELLHRMATQGGPEGKKAALWSLAMLMLLSGVGGLPFASDAEDILDGIMQSLGYSWSTKQVRKQFLINTLGAGAADFVERGVSGLPGAPIDVSGRLGMGNLIPGTGLMVHKADHMRDVTEIAGPMADLVSRAYTGAGQALDGHPILGAMTMSPKASENLRKGVEMLLDGEYKDTKGRKVMNVSTADGIGKLIGFQPNDVAEESSRAYAVQNFRAQNTLAKSEFAADMAQAVNDKDFEAQKAVRHDVAEWNRKNPHSPMTIDMAAVRRRVMAMRQDRATRAAKAAPKAIRAEAKAQLKEGKN